MTQCHNQEPIKSKRDGTFLIRCPSSGRTASGASVESVFAVWEEMMARASPATTRAQDNSRALVVLESASNFGGYVENHIKDIAAISAPFVRSDRPAFGRMVRKLVKYVEGLTGTAAWDKVWSTQEGRESIVEAGEEALMLGATVPEMGSIVPFGAVAEFIPAVEAYVFAATTGASAPFYDLQIEPIYDKDRYHIERKNGDFSLSFDSILVDRGEVAAIAVYGRAKTGKTIGEVYPVKRLLEKAQAHSASYRAYLADLKAFEMAKAEGRMEYDEGREFIFRTVSGKYGDRFAEQDRKLFEDAEKAGKLKSDGGGEYVEKTIPGKGDKKAWIKKLYRSDIENPGTEKKKVYRDEIVNPYDGPDRPEMLKKLAGKSFLYPWIKTRNSTAAISELEADDDMDALLDNALGMAFDSVPGEMGARAEAIAEGFHAEVVPEEAATPTPEPEPARGPSKPKVQPAKTATAPTEEQEEILF